MLSIDRTYRGEEVVLPRLIKDPAARSIDDIAQTIRHAKAASLHDIKDFRRAVAIAKLPGRLRRLVWWLGFNIGRQRANYFGTFVISTVAAFGGDSLNLPLVTTIFLTYGFIDADQRCKVRVAFDHRVFDGVAVARALVRLEAILNTAIVEELLGMKAAPAPAAGIKPAQVFAEIAGR